MNVRYIAIVALAATFTASADGLPFWGDASPSTNRSPAAAASASPSLGFESRIYVERSQTLQEFTSQKRGFTIIVM